MTSVKYSSSNESVATVDASTGVVTVHMAGYATITATAEADDVYYGATATYTIESTSSSVQTWLYPMAMPCRTITAASRPSP